MILDEMVKQLRYVGINKGDVLVISSDVKNLLLKLIEEDRIEARKTGKRKGKKKIDDYLDCIINALQDLVGAEGTLMFHTFYWSFCHGKSFDYDHTLSETGILSNRALTRLDFVRTKHPIYSFAVWGKDSAYLQSLNNKDAFSIDSPFAYIHEKKAKYVMIDTIAWSFFHYIEQINNVEYRFVKKFTAPYIENGHSEERTYSMFVRYLSLEVEQLIFWETLMMGSSQHRLYVEKIPIDVVFCDEAFAQITQDIVENQARNLVEYRRDLILRGNLSEE